MYDPLAHKDASKKTENVKLPLHMFPFTFLFLYGIIASMADAPALSDYQKAQLGLTQEELAKNALPQEPSDIPYDYGRPKKASKWFRPLSPAEMAMQGAFLGLGAVDWGQTIKFTQDPAWQAKGVYETNPVLGKHPSRAKVNMLIPLGLAAHTLGTWALPRPYRNILQIAGLAGETNAVIGNHRSGVRPTWPWK